MKKRSGFISMLFLLTSLLTGCGVKTPPVEGPPADTTEIVSNVQYVSDLNWVSAYHEGNVNHPEGKSTGIYKDKDFKNNKIELYELPGGFKTDAKYLQDRSYANVTGLTLLGSYEKGLSVKANSQIVYNVPADVNTFRSYVGVPYKVPAYGSNSRVHGTVIFSVLVDGVEMHRSEVMDAIYNNNEFVDVRLPDGAEKVTLKAWYAGDELTYSNGVWGDAQFCKVDGGRLARLDAIAESEVIAVGNSMRIKNITGTLRDGSAASFDYLGFSVNDGAAVQVSKDNNEGVIKALHAGTATVTVIAQAGGQTVTKDITVSVVSTENVVKVESPSKTLTMNFALDSKNSLKYWVTNKAGQYIVNLSSIGLNLNQVSDDNMKYYNAEMVVDNAGKNIFEPYADFTRGVTVNSVADVSVVNDTTGYQVYARKKETYFNSYSRTTIKLGKDGKELSVLVKVFDDGVAYRYQLSTGTSFNLAIVEESSSYNLPNGSKAWTGRYNDFNFCYETEYIEEAKEHWSGSYSNPFLFETADGNFGLITESDLNYEYVGTMLQVQPNKELKVEFPFKFYEYEDASYHKYTTRRVRPVVLSVPFLSQWRTVIIGDLNTIATNTVVENLSRQPYESTKTTDYSWVKPGAVAWSWLSGIDQRDLAATKQHIDIAAELGWKYYTIDGGSNTNDHKEIVAYGKSKGVGIILWTWMGAFYTRARTEEIISGYAKDGFVGLKVDFFLGEDQENLRRMEYIYEVAADNKIMLNIHGANIPTGEVRTYPHVLTREGIRGGEHAMFEDGYTTSNATIHPFSRSAIGPGDITEGISYAGSGDYYADQMTVGAEIALTVTNLSGLHHFGASASEIWNSPIYYFYKNIPVVWDDTKLLDGYPGRNAVMLRRSGQDYYLAEITTQTKHDAVYDMSFLGEGTYYALVFYEDPNNINLVKSRVEEVTKTSKITVPLNKNGGMAIKILKTKPGYWSAAGTSSAPGMPS